MYYFYFCIPNIFDFETFSFHTADFLFPPLARGGGAKGL